MGMSFSYGPPPDKKEMIALIRAAVDLGGGRRLESFDSPGHARHHVGLPAGKPGAAGT